MALVSFTVAFMVARTFTSLYPTAVFKTSEFHIHHFWYGIAMLAIGGWLGICYDSERTSRIAAILFGAGGGLIADEAGLLLTFGDYWTEITYTVVVIFLVIVSILILLNKYSTAIFREFTQFSRQITSLYVGIFLAAVSIWFILITENTIIMTASSIVTIAAFIIILTYFIQQFRKRKP